MKKKDLMKKIGLKYSDLSDWGTILNDLQDIACEKLPQQSVKRFLKESNADAKKCEDMDYILLNGKIFDWRVFITKAPQVIEAFLDYFSEDELEIIGKGLAV